MIEAIDGRLAAAMPEGGTGGVRITAMWLWMPAMMVFGGLMWLMMGT
ncbi:MAG TPA: hypothetical protein VMM12_17435 [Longimicrobiales bacterium]|nr:hypothetical protein [Longimicrobiales bacterium]